MKLHEIQAKLKAPKNQFNSFGKYKYRSCEDILEAVKPLLGDSFLTISDEVVIVGDRVYIKATATFVEGTNTVEVSAYAREPESKKGMDESQITGAASSYARKYALNGLFLIDDTKDADTTNKHEKGDSNAEYNKRKEMFIDACKKEGVNAKDFGEKHNAKEKLNSDEGLSKLMQALIKKRDGEPVQ